MSKANRKRDEQLVIRVAGSLRRELEAGAVEEGRELTDFARRLWLAWAADHMARDQEAA